LGTKCAAAGVTHFASIGSEFAEEPPCNDSSVCCCVTVTDDEEQSDAMNASLEKIVQFIDSAIEHGGCALVHCAAGISRSSTVVLAYLVAKQHMSLFDAFRHIKTKRIVVWPNLGFMRVLIEWEQRHRGGIATMRLSQYTLWTGFDESSYKAARIVDRH